MEKMLDTRDEADARVEKMMDDAQSKFKELIKKIEDLDENTLPNNEPSYGNLLDKDEEDDVPRKERDVDVELEKRTIF